MHDVQTPDSGQDTLSVAESRQFALDIARETQHEALIENADSCAEIVAGITDDPTLVSASYLHPLVQANLLKVDKIRQRFGPELAEFCQQLHKLDQLQLATGQDRDAAATSDQAEALRRMLLAVVNDIRLILVRLAATLVALRAARFESSERQRTLGIEVRDLYAPLANRLGVWQLKWELEDLSFRFLEPDAYKELAQALKARRADRERYLEQVKHILGDELEKAGIKADLAGRPKHIFSIWKKMQKKEKTLDEIFDLRAVRILVDDVTQCYAALGVVHNLWSYLPQEFDDYIANPKGNLYRSLHTAVVGPDKLTLEIQIRTHEMHEHAELGVAAHWRYKEGGQQQPAFEQKIRWLRQLLEPGSNEAQAGAEFLDNVREEILEDRVYAISPKGDIVDLPSGATPLDFAYHVHTEVGHRCRGAKINGRIVPLAYVIQNGDKVEIITGKDANPSRDWLIPRLGFLASSRSRAKVRSWFRQLDKELNKKQGREILERELQRLNVRDLPLQALCKQLKQNSADSLCIALGAGDLTAAAIASAVQHLQTPSDDTDNFARRSRQVRQDSRGIEKQISGIGDMLSQFARCCRPVPPDLIGGYITLGRGVSIHRTDCGNYKRLANESPERVMPVSWNASGSDRYESDIRIEAMDKHGLLRDVSSILSDENIDILASSSRVDNSRQRALLTMSVVVEDLQTLSRALNRLSALPDVLLVERRG
ncbi:MAG: bifunctional (p)ppGpp synthetase/guanosine-3',5'-bis(diphosphate) 3'-pyrophosphohydrolase [Pseudomonadota bacterium]